MKTEKFKNPIESAIWIALNAHEGQLDKAGNPYILHPLRVAIKLHSNDEIIAAFLHDVIEDSNISINELKQAGFSDKALRIVMLMTKNDDDNYDDYINRIKDYPPAIRVKLADLEDNMNLMRIKNPEPKDHERISKYKKAHDLLSKHLV